MPRHYADWIETYLSLVRDRTEAPELFHFWSAVSTIGAAVTRHVFIDEIAYKIFPNWFTVLTARPGVAKKSTTANACMSILREVKPENFGPDETNWQDLCRILAERTVAENIDGIPSDILSGTCEIQCAVTFCISEFGNFLKHDDILMVEGLTDLWDCRDHPYIKSTKTMGVDHIQNPFVNILACSTAKKLRDNFKVYTGWGIASRIIFVYFDGKTKPIWSPAELIGADEWQETRMLLGKDILHISELRGRASFTNEAKKIARDWYAANIDYIQGYAEKDDADEWVVDFMARKQIHVHKLAMTLSLARRDNLQITVKDYLDAIEKVDEVENELRRVFGVHLTPNENALNERAVYHRVVQELSNGLGRSATKKHILNRMATFVDGASADRMLTSFIRRGLLLESITRDGQMLTLVEETPDEHSH